MSAVAVGTIIGFILDKTFGTKPWLILIFFFVGVIAGITNVIKSAKKYAKIDINFMAANPMTQFEVYRIGPEIKIGAFDISFTNASLFMVVSSLAILIIFNIGSKKNYSILPSKIQLLAELSYTFVSKMISDTAGSKAKPYFAFIFSLFMFVLFCNMFGMIPYTFTVTSHIIVTFVLAAFIFIGVTIIGFIKHGFGYLKLFVPSGVPIVLLPLIVVIEIISYLSQTNKFIS